MTERGLGKGLGALLGVDAVDGVSGAGAPEGIVNLRISQIEPNRDQPRRLFESESLLELADSIREHGVIQPLTVRRRESGYYQIIAGERRWRASRMAGLESVPVIIIEADDRKAMELALIENLQREDLNPLEEAEGFRALIETFGLTQEEASARVGRSRPAVANALRLLTLPQSVKNFIEQGALTPGHARAVLQIKDAKKQELAASRIVDAELNVRQAEALAKKLNAEQTKDEKSPMSINYLEDVEKQLSGKLGRRVRIFNGRKKGRVEIEFYGDDDLEAVVELIASANIL